MWGRELIKLADFNYREWKFCVMAVLQAEGLDGYVDGTEKEPNRETCFADWTKWKKSTAQAKLILLASIDPAKINVGHGLGRDPSFCKTARDMWLHLEFQNDLFGFR